MEELGFIKMKSTCFVKDLAKEIRQTPDLGEMFTRHLPGQELVSEQKERSPFDNRKADNPVLKVDYK